jgi:hypothetical protein
MVPARPVLKRPLPKADAPDELLTEEEGKGKGRAPRSCVICQSFVCKGRGGRSFCPMFDPENPIHQVPEPRRYKRATRSQKSAEPHGGLESPELPTSANSILPDLQGVSAENANEFEQHTFDNFFMYSSEDLHAEHFTHHLDYGTGVETEPAHKRTRYD